jgi:hypothetical protein
LEDKEKEETEEHLFARESSVDDDDDEDETPVSPVPDIESEVCKSFCLYPFFLFPYVDFIFANKYNYLIH